MQDQEFLINFCPPISYQAAKFWRKSCKIVTDNAQKRKYIFSLISMQTLIIYAIVQHYNHSHFESRSLWHL